MSAMNYALKVPVTMPNVRAIPTRAQRMAKLAEKRRIMTARALYEKGRLLAHRRAQADAVACWCKTRPIASYCHYVNMSNSPSWKSKMGADGYHYLPAEHALGSADDFRTVYTYLGPIYIRSGYRMNDTEWDIMLQQEAISYFAQGYSWVEQACNCRGCRTQRAAVWVNTPMGRRGTPEELTRQEMLAWDRANNPFSAHYQRPAGERTTRRQRTGMGLPTGAGCDGQNFTDPGAKGGAARLVGVEVEHNVNVSLPEWCAAYPGAVVIRDGSCGYEAVTPPIAGKHIVGCLTLLMKHLNERKAGCDKSCGLHVHVDARDMGWAEMMRFLTVYTRLEPLMFLLGGQYRLQDNQYCKAVAGLYEKALRNPDPKGAILAAAVLSQREDYLPAPSEGRKLMRVTPDKKHGGRYKAVNIMPWIAGRAYKRPDTTVEFRLHRGSHNAERVIRWVTICQDLVDWCIRKDNRDVEALPKSAARSLAIISPRNAEWVARRLLGYRKATSAAKGQVEDDAGRIVPKRLVTVKGGLYTINKSRIGLLSSGD